jgi:hypothetical protein
LPAAADDPHRVYYVKDATGDAGTNNVTVQVTGGGNIDGAPTVLITANYGVGRFISNGAQWFTL